MKLDVEGKTMAGSWSPAQPSAIRQIPLGASFRRDVLAEWKRRGFRYFLIDPDTPGYEDLRHYRTLWGVRLLDHAGRTRLYEIE